MSHDPGWGPYAPPMPPPLPPRLPLSRAQRIRAWIAGGVGFGMLSIGWTLASTSVLVAALWAFFAWLFTFVERRDPSGAEGIRRFLDGFSSLPLRLVVLGLVVAFLLGVGVWIAGLFVSRGLLRGAGHPHPWGVTWAGFGIAVGASWIIDGVVQAVAQLFAGVIAQSPGGVTGTLRYLEQLLIWGSVLSVVVVVIHVVIGALAWWWMAWAMRARSSVGGTGS